MNSMRNHNHDFRSKKVNLFLDLVTLKMRLEDLSHKNDLDESINLSSIVDKFYHYELNRREKIYVDFIRRSV